MSTAVVSTSAALGRHFVFDAEETLELPCSDPSTIKNQQSTISPATGNRKSPAGNFPRTPDRFVAIDPRLASVKPASRLGIRPAPEMVSSGIAGLDELTGGLPRGCLTEICGAASSGRTGLLLAALSAATRRRECCALIDANDALDPQSAAAAGVVFDRLLWVRCGESSPQKSSLGKHNAGSKKDEWRNAESRLEQVLRATDLLLESGGFGLIALDLADLPPQVARRIPLATWFRFRRAVEPTSTVLLALEQQSIAGSCSSLLVRLQADSGCYSQKSPLIFSGDHAPSTEIPHVPAHTRLLEQIEINAEVIRSRLQRKPVGPAAIAFATKTAWTDIKAG